MANEGSHVWLEKVERTEKGRLSVYVEVTARSTVQYAEDSAKNNVLNS